ncbi:hypothetical protein D3C72_1158850 [compost metagenome]
MAKRLGNFLLAVLILSGSLSAQGAQYRCQAVLRPSIAQVLASLDKDNQGFLFKNDLQSFSEGLSWNRKRKLRNILNHQFLGNAISEKEVARLATELTTILFGVRETVDNFIFKSKDQQLNDSAIGLAQEKLLRRGLIDAWGGKYSPNKTGLLSDLVMGLRWTNDKALILHTAIARTPLSLPLLLPLRKNSEISDQLMRKIILDGVDKHIDEIRIALKEQSSIEAYNTVRRLYTPVLIGSVLTVGIIIAYLIVQDEKERSFHEQLSGLERMRDEIAKVSAAKDLIIQEAYEGARQDFIKKWGGEPTSEEAAELRQKVIKGIFGASSQSESDIGK